MTKQKKIMLPSADQLFKDFKFIEKKKMQMIPLHKYSNPYLGQITFSTGAFILLEDTTLQVKLSCGKFNWMGMIWNRSRILINV